MSKSNGKCTEIRISNAVSSFQRAEDRLRKSSIGGTFVPNRVPLYEGLVRPKGFLLPDLACHALFHYFNTAASNWKREKERILLEGERDMYNYHQLFLSIARMYAVDPNDMEKFWSVVDFQADVLGLTRLPAERKYRSPKGMLS